MKAEPLQIAKRIARDLSKKGAQAVVIVGSHVRGDQYSDSDLDIIAIGRGPSYRLERVQGRLASISWRTTNQIRHGFRNPATVGATVPGWRRAMPLYDPSGIGAGLVKEAKVWEWSLVSKKCDGWVAESITGWAEEVHKLVGNLGKGRKWAALVQRNLLADHLAFVLSVHYRIMYDTENKIHDLVARRAGPTWAKTQAEAFGEHGESVEQSCHAALRLYALAVRVVRHLLNPRQYEVVAHACEVAGHPLVN
jgi:hypothetical protein